MKDCVFCQIVNGELACHKVWEDENYLAFLNIKPESKGHTLVIPRKHVRWVWQVKDFAGYMEKVREVALLLQEKYKAQWILLKVIGTDVPHAHVHLVPQYTRVSE